MEPKQELRLSIETVASDGRGVARVEGYVVFVDGGVQGDLLEVRIRRRRRRFAEAEIVAVIEPGGARRTPRCRYAGVSVAAH